MFYTHVDKRVRVPNAMICFCSIIFWTTGKDILMKNLNGLILKTCYSLTTEPLALTLDVENQIIYWMTFTNEDNTAWLQQLDYTTEECGTRYIKHYLAQCIICVCLCVLLHRTHMYIKFCFVQREL